MDGRVAGDDYSNQPQSVENTWRTSALQIQISDQEEHVRSPGIV
jgi:hypothetical protein